MNSARRSNLAIGLILILLGVWFLAVQLVPGLGDWFELTFSWPMIVIGVGVLLLVLGLLLRAPGMAVPACIVGGIGGILYWQDATGNFESWSYAWALIPGFVGVGIVLSALLGGGGRSEYSEGGRLVFISLVLFAVFGLLFGAFGPARNYWPILIILAGIWLLVRAFFRRRP